MTSLQRYGSSPKVRLTMMLRRFTGCSLRAAVDFAKAYPHLVDAEAARLDWAKDPELKAMTRGWKR